MSEGPENKLTDNRDDICCFGMVSNAEDILNSLTIETASWTIVQHNDTNYWRF